ncbi:MAG: uncharacterized protein HW411_254 [Gammaproteobacteria bacterium]|nr:uncharacterized protein [Gammaproteobacteria bacterium]
MKSITRLLLILFSLITIAFAMSTQAAIKCWTNKDGVKECGDRIPPEYSQTGHQELNKQGLVVDETERAKTGEELEEAKKLAAVKAEEDRIAAEQAKKDQILLDTFSSVDDLQMARDGKIAAIESSISLAQKRNEKMQQDLDKWVEKAAAEERSGKAPPEDLLKDIETLRGNIENNNAFIAEKHAEQETVKAAYTKDIERFNELKSAGK